MFVSSWFCASSSTADGNGFNGLRYQGRMSFQALPVTSKDRTSITLCETLSPLATCCVSSVTNLLGSCSALPELCFSLLILRTLPGFASTLILTGFCWEWVL